MKAQIVSFHCVMKNRFGQILSSSFNKDVINQLEFEESQKLRGLVAGIQNVQEGEKREVFVTSNDAYGPYDPALVTRVRRSELSQGEQLHVGSEVIGRASAKEPVRTFRVIRVEGDDLVLDGNHPLAGHDLVFEIEVVSAREAREEDFEEMSDSIPASAPQPFQWVH